MVAMIALHADLRTCFLCSLLYKFNGGWRISSESHGDLNASDVSLMQILFVKHKFK